MNTDLVTPYDLILEQANAELIEAVVIGSATMVLLEMTDERPIVDIPPTKLGVPLTLEKSRPFLDYQVEVYEPHGVSPVAAWTQNWIISIFDDGPIRAVRVPRHPMPGEPPEWRI